MGQFNAFALGGKDNGVIANDIAGALERMRKSQRAVDQREAHRHRLLRALRVRVNHAGTAFRVPLDALVLALHALGPRGAAHLLFDPGGAHLDGRAAQEPPEGDDAGGDQERAAEGKTDDAGVNFETGALVPVNFDAMVPVPEGKGFEVTEWWYAQGFADGKFEPTGRHVGHRPFLRSLAIKAHIYDR